MSGLIDRAAMTCLSRIVMFAHSGAASTNVTTFMYSEAVFTRLEAVKRAFNNAGFWIDLREPHHTLNNMVIVIYVIGCQTLHSETFGSETFDSRHLNPDT